MSAETIERLVQETNTVLNDLDFAAPETDSYWDSDEALEILLAKQGDGEAFGALYQRHYGAVFAFARKLTRNHHEAEDFTQDTFASAYGSIEAFQDNGRGMHGWLFTICKNRYLDYMKQVDRRQTVAVDPATIAEKTPETVSSERIAISRVSTSETVAKLSGLMSDRYLKVLLLDAYGYTGVEIAEVIDVSPARARKLLFKARNSLERGVLRGQVDLPEGIHGYDRHHSVNSHAD